MNSETREYALTLLSQKEHDPKLTYTVITRLTGYSKRQLIRLSEELKTKDMDSILTHGNTGRKPAITAFFGQYSGTIHIEPKERSLRHGGRGQRELKPLPGMRRKIMRICRCYAGT